MYHQPFLPLQFSILVHFHHLNFLSIIFCYFHPSYLCVQLFFCEELFKKKGEGKHNIKRRFSKTGFRLFCRLFEAARPQMAKELKAEDETHSRCKTHLNARDLGFVKKKYRQLIVMLLSKWQSFIQ